MTIISEAFSEVRRVYLDRPQWKIEDVAPGYYGRSVGHWDGDTLVVDTVGVKPAAAGYRGMPHSAQMRVTDRIRMLSPEMLQDQVTIEDPVVLEKPAVYTLAFQTHARRLRNGSNLFAITIVNTSTRRVSSG